MVLESLNSSKFAPIPKEKLMSIRGGDDTTTESTGQSGKPARVNGKDVYYYHDCGTLRQDGTWYWEWYDQNWEIIAHWQG